VDHRVTHGTSQGQVNGEHEPPESLESLFGLNLHVLVPHIDLDVHGTLIKVERPHVVHLARDPGTAHLVAGTAGAMSGEHAQIAVALVAELLEFLDELVKCHGHVHPMVITARVTVKRCGVKEIKYGAIPTIYKKIQFRSRLEARFACFLDSYGLVWDYEPLELRKYVPDFVVDFEFGPTLVELKPAVRPLEFKPACRKITRSGWTGPALVVGSQLSLAPDDRADLTMFGSLAAEDGEWSRVGRERWPADWLEYPFMDGLFDRWVAAGNATQWNPPSSG
jgi:hypothetical protein